MLTEELMKEVRRLEIRARRRVDDVFGGEYHSAFKGQGIEFAEVREYEPGDDVRSIDWNVTARVGRPFVKRFTEERQQTVIVAVDVSASGRFGSTDRSKGRLSVEVAAVLALSAARNNDRVGLVLFSAGVDRFIPPTKGRTHQLRMLRELLGAEPAGPSSGLGEALSTLDRVLHRRSIVFVISDFDAGGAGEPEDWTTPMRLLSRRHEVVALTVSDPREQSLPRLGLITFEDPETGRRVLFDTGSGRRRRRFAARARRDDDALLATLRRCGVDRVALSTGRPFGDDLARYFRARERRR